MKDFTFICPECEFVLELDNSPDEVPECKTCGCYLDRIFEQFKQVNIGDRPYSRPLHSDSLAITPGQVEEHKRLFPNVQIDEQCRPVFTNYRQHNDYLNAIGVEKAPQRIRKIKPHIS